MGATRDQVSAFGATFGGSLLVEGDTDYESARSIWNGSIAKRPAVIARPSTPADVSGAIAFAREHQMEISVRGGGHSYSGTALVDGGLTIDLSGMHSVSVDPTARRARVEGGATWADLDVATQAHGLAVTGGFISHTGVGGLTLGGGMGWLTRKAGLTIDNLVGTEVVTADGRLLRASSTEHEDLFWGLRGGGGNFGVVTTFEFALHEVGPLVNLALFFWDVPRGRDALQFARDFVRSLPADYGALIAGLSAPPAPFVPAEHHFKPGFVLGVMGTGTIDELVAAVAPLRQNVSPLFELVTPIPYVELQKMLDDAAPWGAWGYEKAMYIDGLNDAVIDLMVDFIPRKQSPLTILPIFDLSCGFSAVGEDETAFGGTRAPGLGFNISAIALTPELFEADRAWVREFWDAMLPHARGSGSYVNFMSEYEKDRVRASYGASKYERLSRIKATYDPENVFHINANIEPASLERGGSRRDRGVPR